MTELEQFYPEHEGWIRASANRMAWRFGCMHLEEDFAAVGALAFVKYIGRYDEGKGQSLEAWLRRHIEGDMRRFAEQNVGAVTVPKRSFHLIRKAHAIYNNVQGETTAERLAVAAEQMGLSFDEVVALLSHQSRYASLDAVSEDEDGYPVEPMIEALPSAEPEPELVFEDKVYRERAEAAFHRLSHKERTILGGCTSLFGQKKRTLADLGEEFYILAAIGDIFLSTWLHLTLKGRFTGGADLRISNCVQSLMSDSSHRLMYLMILLVLACALVALFLMEQGKENYASDTVKITEKITVPVPIGQGQHGTAKWLDKKQYDHVFSPVELGPQDKRAAMLVQHGYDDLNKEDDTRQDENTQPATGAGEKAGPRPD